jgi:PAT family beta-lactamase induction signal transducer AmpG
MEADVEQSPSPYPKLGPPEENLGNPWWFVTPLYFMQAIPAALVNDVAPLIYKEFGVDNASITRWTGLVALPWAVKMFFGPFVELNSTRRKWILATQALIVLGILGVAFAMQMPNFAAFSLAFLGITALFSATCDIATDGFYLMSLSRPRQAAFAGVLTTASRLGRLFCTSILVMLAGFLEKEQHFSPAMGWLSVLCVCAAVYGAGRVVLGFSLPKPSLDIAPPAVPGENWKNLARTICIVVTAFFVYFTLQSILRIVANELALSLHTLPLLGDLKGWLLTPKALRADLRQLTECIPGSLFGGLASYRLMHRTPTGEAFGTFFRQEKIGYVLAFILFYRMSEAMVGKIAPLFLKDDRAKGGMQMTLEQIGFYNGTLGVLGIMAGGILGGILVSKLGLRRAFWPLALAMHLPNLLYLWAAATHPPIPAIGIVAFVDQMGYGVGYAAYMVYLMFVAQRSNFRTSHYAIATGLGVLTIQTSGILSGIIQTNFGYVNFFIAVMFLAIPGILTLLFIPLEDRGAQAAS